MRKLALALLLLTLSACGASAPTGTDSTGASTPAVPSASAPAPSTAPSTDASAMPSMSGELNTGTSAAPAGNTAALEQKGSAMLAANINVAPDTLKLVTKDQQEWSDGSLGCPDPAAMYAQVITPGWKLTYNDGARDYDVRSNQDGSVMVWCENGAPKTLPQP